MPMKTLIPKSTDLLTINNIFAIPTHSNLLPKQPKPKTPPVNTKTKSSTSFVLQADVAKHLISEIQCFENNTSNININHPKETKVNKISSLISHSKHITHSNEDFYENFLSNLKKEEHTPVKKQPCVSVIKHLHRNKRNSYSFLINHNDSKTSQKSAGGSKIREIPSGYVKMKNVKHLHLDMPHKRHIGDKLKHSHHNLKLNNFNLTANSLKGSSVGMGSPDRSKGRGDGLNNKSDCISGINQVKTNFCEMNNNNNNNIHIYNKGNGDVKGKERGMTTEVKKKKKSLFCCVPFKGGD